MILVLNGSPNKKSKTMEMTNFLVSNKETVEIINAYDLNIISCDDCKSCNFKIGCPKNDDMDSIYKLLDSTTTLIISSPIYFGAMSDRLMAIINRFQRYFGQKFELKDDNIPSISNIILITSQGSMKNKMNNGAILTLEILVALFKPKYYKIIQAKNTDVIDPLTIKSIVKKIEKVQNRI